MRMYLSIDGKTLTETWNYQYTPPPLKDRKAGLS
jgi:glucan biosynthesis protein